MSNSEFQRLVLERVEKRRGEERSNGNSTSLSPSTLPRTSLPTKDDIETLESLKAITTTPYEQSFVSRLRGTRHGPLEGALPGSVVHIDWETDTIWMRLMEDVRDHHVMLHGMPLGGDDHNETRAPIIYTTLQRSHLPQVHDLLERMFWSGIDVTDSLEYQPEQATIIAMYKKLVVGVAILSSPRETYITFLAVRAGWDKAQIARTMLYLLVTRNPGRDITLHVSVNNSAMLLYNQFGFKAEEFVAGFYEDYLDPLSRASTNAFKLRLRH